MIVRRMVGTLGALLIGGLLSHSEPAVAHHSFAMFDQENPIELVGVLQEFKYTSPHTFLILRVKGPDGGETTWSLRGAQP